MATYGALPDAGLVDTLEEGQRLTTVGYGATGFHLGGEPPPRPVYTDDRYRAMVRLLTTNNAVGDHVLKTTGISLVGGGEGSPVSGIRAGRCSCPTRRPSWALPRLAQPPCAGDQPTTNEWTYHRS